MADQSEIGEAYVKIRPKANPGEFQRETEQSLRPATQAAGDTLSRDLAGALTAGAFIAFSASVVTSAAEAEQAVGGTAAVFKDAKGQIDAFAESSASSIGLTEQATRQFTSQIGSALKGYGFSIDEAATKSQDLVTLGADLTATFGGSVPDAVTALSAALRGEFDPLERFGVSLTAAAVGARAVELGLASSASAVDGHAKALATLSIIQEQTVDSQGQFTRELSTAGGQLAVTTAKLGDARDELGSKFLPLVTKGAALVAGLADSFGALPGPVQGATVAIVGLIALSGPLGKVKGSVGDLVETFKQGGDEADAFKGKLSALAKTGVVVAGIAAITGGIEAFKAATADQQDAFAKSLPDPSDIDGYVAAVDTAIERQAALSDELNKFDGAGLAAAPEIGAKAWDFFTSSISGNVSEVGRAKAEYDALTASIPAAKLKAEELTSAVNTLGDRLGISGTQAANLVDDFKGLDLTQVPMDRLVDVLGRLRSGQIDTATAAEQLGVKVSTAGDKAADAADKLDDLKSGLIGLVDAQHSYEDSVQSVADAQRNAERAQTAVADAQRSYAQAISTVGDAQDSYQDAVRSTQDAEERRVESLRSVEDATRSLEEAQRRLTEAQQGPTESDNLDIEAAELRLAQMRRDLATGEFDTPGDRRLAEIEIRRAEIDLAERKAEIDARVLEAQDGVTDASERLAEAQRSADDASRAVTDAQEAQRDAAVAITDAQYNASKAYDAITTAQYNAEKASRDVERAKYDQVKASEELAKKLGEETLALAGANEEARKLDEYFRNLVAIHPELSAAIQPLLFLLSAAANPNRGAPFDANSGFSGPQGATPPGVSNIGQPFDAGSGFTGPQGVGNGITQVNNFGPMDPEEAISVANQRLAQAVGW